MLNKPVACVCQAIEGHALSPEFDLTTTERFLRHTFRKKAFDDDLNDAHDDSDRQNVHHGKIEIYFAVINIYEVSRLRQKRQKEQASYVRRRYSHKNAECLYELPNIHKSECDKDYQRPRKQFCKRVQKKRKLRKAYGKSVNNGQDDRADKSQRFCVKAQNTRGQPQNNGIHDHIDKYKNIDVNSQSHHRPHFITEHPKNMSQYDTAIDKKI